VTVQIVKRAVGVYTCQHCHKRNEISDQPFDNKPGDRTPTPNATPLHAAAVPTADAPAEPAKPEQPSVMYRNDVASGFHAAVLGKRQEVAPLKKFQPGIYDKAPRNVSPMSSPGIDPRPRREYAPGGSALDDPNPSRKVN